MTKKCNKGLLIYELKNIVGNPYTLVFGFFFTIVLSAIISFSLKVEITDPTLYRTACTGVFLNMGTVIPMVIILLGYGANYSQELEKDVPLRMSLFGFPQNAMLMAKIIAQLISMTVAVVIYTIYGIFFLKILIPDAVIAFITIACIYILFIIFFLLAHGLATIFRKFGPTYGICMFLYFIFMMLCGMMGTSVDKYPAFLQNISYTLPMTYMCNDFIDFWQGGKYNFVPLIQSFLFLGAVSVLILLYALHRDKRRL